MTRIAMFLALCVFAGCASNAQGPAADGGACSCASKLEQLQVSTCVPQTDGSCADAGVRDGSFADVIDYLCNYADTADSGTVKPDISCEAATYTVSCRGETHHFTLVAGDAGECRAEAAP